MPPTTETKPKKTRSIEHMAASLAQTLAKLDIRVIKLQGDLAAAKALRDMAAKEADPKVLAMAEAIRSASNGDAKATGKADGRG